MSEIENQPVVTQQTIAQNEAIENVLTRFKNREIVIPQYQRDADQWDDHKKSLFIESVLNRLTIPAFYFALSETDRDVSEVVDGQQRLTTLAAFYENELELSQSDKCPYYGTSPHYAGKKFNELDEVWKKTFRRYSLTLVTLPENVDLSIRLEIFRRINEGGTPLTGQDIRLSYYSQSSCVRFIQAVGIFDPSRPGSKRMIESLNDSWPWQQGSDRGKQWQEWWEDSKAAVGQTASEMFLWYLIGELREKVDAILKDEKVIGDLKLRFRGNSEEVLDIICARFKQEELSDEPRLLPQLHDLKTTYFPRFADWWYKLRIQCGPRASVAKHRTIALLIPALQREFGDSDLSGTQWNIISKFLNSSREVAKNELCVKLTEPRGKWKSQRSQLDDFDNVAKEIKKQ